jgi:phosphate transport system ATP-binding protein
MNDLIDGTKKMTSVIIDGVDIYGKNTNVDALRKNVGMVFPNPFQRLFMNVAYGFASEWNYR